MRTASGNAGERRLLAAAQLPPADAALRTGRQAAARSTRSASSAAHAVRMPRRSLTCAASSAASVSLGAPAVYSRPLARSSAVDRLPQWFEPCLRHIVANLSRAPFLQAVYDASGHLMSGTQFTTHPVSEAIVADPTAWLDLVKTSDNRLANTVIFVHEVSSHSACSLTGRPREAAEQCSDSSESPAVLRDGLLGDCEDERRDECNDGKLVSTVTKYWGLVMQSPAGGPSGCYLLKTEQSSGGHCSCTHFSLTRVCQGVSLAQQALDAWRAK